MNYTEALKKDILPFWLDHAMDWEHGGIFTCLDEKGDLYGTEKSVWFQGRTLWTLSKAYNLIDHNAEIEHGNYFFESLAQITLGFFVSTLAVSNLRGSHELSLMYRCCIY